MLIIFRIYPFFHELFLILLNIFLPLLKKIFYKQLLRISQVFPFAVFITPSNVSLEENIVYQDQTSGHSQDVTMRHMICFTFARKLNMMDVSFITLNYKMNCKFDIKYVFHTDRVFCIVNYVCQNRFGDTRVLWFLTSKIRVQYNSLVTRFVLRQDIYFDQITIIRAKQKKKKRKHFKYL